MTYETKSRTAPGVLTTLLIVAVFLGTAAVLWLDPWDHVEPLSPNPPVKFDFSLPALVRVDPEPDLFYGSENCKGCHSKREYKKLWNDWTKGGHKDVECETCHGPAGDHALADVDPRPKMPVTLQMLAQPHVLCMGCHRKIPERETTNRRIELEKHLAEFKVNKEEQEEFEKARQCLSCHPPHRPVKK